MLHEIGNTSISCNMLHPSLSPDKLCCMQHVATGCMQQMLHSVCWALLMICVCTFVRWSDYFKS